MGENIYLFMIAALAILAIADLVVGVSNDAVNFLNSAIGSKAVSFKTIMIVASIGITLGAVSSSGMMDIAKTGIFNPNNFFFSEVMIIFMAVMITDILLLDFFNTLGMPTSTTVSIVFELLGAAVAISILKIFDLDDSLMTLGDYINTDKAIQIIFGILLSVVVAFSTGAIIQYITRLLITFNFDNKPKWISSLFGGIAITGIIYFIIVKGLKSASILDGPISDFIAAQTELFILINFIVWSLATYTLSTLLKVNVYKLIILLGTFALAMAFAGNDLVNFIGVPIAALQSFQDWNSTDILASEYVMSGLANPVKTPVYLLLISGLIMILTIWFSSKAKNVVKTSVDLSRQDEGEERFEPNFLSRIIVRFSSNVSESLTTLLPITAQKKLDERFKKPAPSIIKVKEQDKPAFDLVRAAVNLMVASILISLATSMKLPLSTTYVTFMVAMGTSLADKAWGAESAVYRVAGVLNVIGGWFFTAIVASLAAATIAVIIHYGGFPALIVLLILAFLMITRNYFKQNKKAQEYKAEDTLRKSESSSIQGVIEESANNISNVISRSNKIYTNSIDGIARHDLDALKKNKKGVVKLSKEIDDLRDNIFYFIKNLDDSSVGASNFYISILGYLQDLAQSLEYISKVSHKHIHNNHKKLKYNQIKELKEIDYKLQSVFQKTKEAFESRSFEQIGEILKTKHEAFDLVKQKIAKQVERTRTEESSPKNTALYFSLLQETKDLLTTTMNLIELYYSEHDSSIEPAKIASNEDVEKK
ncbi:inorganic phosphate transporter [Cellulophaga baltica]|uniref:inorganic phosphate transporter n=1 Tax=Cellulophaga TaxID=104264 RepID=UPI001C073490|nr:MULTISPECIES: inorganic phosphate transporter [Cellulophaga]MBU2997671.1 inorganic phosphate transporter [Cellulophaga baltica]MDO6769066.1 inorganic phosphate transporter [Cellulophaga sp. 1_MG-2023]